MPLQMLLNILIAFMWMFLHDTWGIMTFFAGYALGLVMLYALRRFFPQKFYLFRLIASVRLFLLFIKELVMSTIMVAKQVARPKLSIKPGIFRTTTPLKSDWEITIVCCLITLTPGSVVVEVDPEAGVLYIHVMTIPDDQISVIAMKERFEKAIMGVTR